MKKMTIFLIQYLYVMKFWHNVTHLPPPPFKNGALIKNKCQILVSEEGAPTRELQNGAIDLSGGVLGRTDTKH